MKKFFNYIFVSFPQNQTVFPIFIAVLVYYILVGFVFGFTYESNDDPAFENMLRGVYWNTPISNFYFYYRGIAFVFVWLYQWVDIGINWYGWSLIVANFLSTLIIVAVLHVRTNNIYLVLLFLLINTQSIFLVSFTRVSLLLSFSALLLFHFSYLLKSKKLLFGIAAVIFLWAFLMRPNTAFLSFILFVPFLYQGQLNITFIKRTALSSIYLILGIGLLVIVNNFQDKQYTTFIKDSAKITFPVLDYNLKVNTLSYEEEKILYEIKNWFFFDKEVLNTAVIKNFVSDSFIQTFSLKRFYDSTLETISDIAYKPFFAVLLLFILSMFLFSKNLRVKGLFILFYYIGLLLMIGMFLKMEYRVLIPVLSILILFFLFHYSKSIFDLVQKYKYGQNIISILLISVFLFQASLYFKKTKKAFPQSQLENQKLNQSLHSKTVFIMDDVFFNYNPLKYLSINKGLTIIPLTGWNSYNEQTYIYQLNNFKTNNLSSIFESIKNKDGFVFMSKPERLAVLQEILKKNDLEGVFIPQEYLEGINNTKLYVFKSNEYDLENAHK